MRGRSLIEILYEKENRVRILRVGACWSMGGGVARGDPNFCCKNLNDISAMSGDER